MTRLLSVDEDDVGRITRRLFLDIGDHRRNLTGFWVLLVLSGVIASAGVVADSTATVIGAMIVAPLMTPILGTAVAIVLADHRRILGNVGLVLAASSAVVAIGFLLGLLVPLDVVAATNGQVAGRVSPRLIDLVAAIATGLVGAFALVRSDVSDTLPGVAIAISLVPPLAVVGLTLESGEPGQALGALLLFGTNVAAIIATGSAVVLAAGVRQTAGSMGMRLGRLETRAVVPVVLALVLVAVPLTLGSLSVVREQRLISSTEPVAQRWADGVGWDITDVFVREGRLHVVAIGAVPEPSVTTLREDLDAAGLEDVEVEVTLVVGGSRTV